MSALEGRRALETEDDGIGHVARPGRRRRSLLAHAAAPCGTRPSWVITARLS
jgi:hypothetical protein